MGFPDFLLPDPVPPAAANIVDAIVQLLAGTPAVVSALPGGIHGDEGPPDDVFPYAVIGEPDSVREYQSVDTSGTPCDDRVTLTITAYATGKSAAHDVATLIGSTVHDAPLTFADGELLYLRRSNLQITKDPDKGPGGADVWAAMLSLSAIVAGLA